MEPRLQTIIFPVTELDRAKRTFAALLGVEPTMDEPYYAQFDVDGLEIGLDPNGDAKGMTGPVPYWRVADLSRSLQLLLDAGATSDQPVNDYGGRLVASVRDADGNPVGIIQLS